MRRQLPWIAAIALPFALGSVIWVQWPAARPVMPQRPPAARVVTLAWIPAVPELPAAEPAPEIPTLSEAARRQIEIREHALANELAKMWTRNPAELVSVIDDAARNAPAAPSVTLLLAIAHAETNGKILDVSEAGAVGLAQATPIACRQESIEGRLFVTRDYVRGARAYIMKKPLGDADTIASLVVAKDNAKTRERARRLLRSALDLRREGVDELTMLDDYAPANYRETIEEADRRNLKTLKKLGRLLDSGSRGELRAFRDATRRDYRSLKQTQVASWNRYMSDLAGERDRMLAAHFGVSATVAKKTMPYEAGEYLGEHLDVRFSARQMATFLVRHLERKAEEARRIRRSRYGVEEMTAALYNGGSHNVKRMLAGLIASLPETERYMKKVPATRRRLDHSMQIAGAALDLTHERTLR
jgi:hypothetical protein